MVFCIVHLNRFTPLLRRAACLVTLPLVRLRHILKLELFISFRINLITSFSFKPNCISMASKLVRSSHAISIMRSISLSFKIIAFIGYLFFLHLSLQYFTSFQTFSHFLRQVKGRLQVIQIFWGKSAFFFCFTKYGLTGVFLNHLTLRQYHHLNFYRPLHHIQIIYDRLRLWYQLFLIPLRPMHFSKL